MSPIVYLKSHYTACRDDYITVLIFGACLLLCYATIGRLVFEFHPRPFVADFSALWAAGKAWAQATSPYSTEYIKIYENFGLLHSYASPPPFFYPPNTILFLAPLGLIPLETASKFWAVFNLCLLAISSILFADFMIARGVRASRLMLVGVHSMIIASLWNAGFVIFAHNVATLLNYAGVLFILRGIQTRSSIPISIGLILCLFKPQLGSSLALALLLHPDMRKPVLLACFCTGLAALMGLLPGGIAPSLSGFLENLTAYSSYPENNATGTSGLGNLLHYALGVDINSFILLATNFSFIIIVFFINRRNFHPTPEGAIKLCVISVVSSLFFLPSHNNYFIVLTPIIVILFGLPVKWWWCIVLASLIHMRSTDILIAFDYFELFNMKRNPSILDTIGVHIFMLCSLVYVFSDRPKKAPLIRQQPELGAGLPAIKDTRV